MEICLIVSGSTHTRCQIYSLLDTSITIWGLLIENVAMALAVPTWCLLHLLTSATVLHLRSTKQQQTTLLVHPLEVDIIPWSVLLGCGIPSVMAFATDATVNHPFYFSQQFWILVRMIHPLLSAVAQLKLSLFSFDNHSKLRDPELRKHTVAQSLGRIWTIASSIAIVSHVSTMTLSLAATLAPSIFMESYQQVFTLQAVFKPVYFWQNTRIFESIDAGVLSFLQWD